MRARFLLSIAGSVCFLACAHAGASGSSGDSSAADAGAGGGSDEEVARRMIGNLSKSQFAAARVDFDDQMKKVTYETTLAAIWLATINKYGEYKEISRLRVEPMADGAAAIVTCRFASGEQTLLISLDSDHRVRGFFLTAAAFVARTFIGHLASGNFDAAEAQFDDTMRQSIPRAKLEELWKGITAQVGAFKQISAATLVANGNIWAALAVCDFDKGSKTFKVVVDGLANISGFWVEPDAAQTPP